MVVFTKGQETTFDLTLSDRTTITNPFYLMVLYSRINSPIAKFLITDTSSYPQRYNQFTVTEGVDFTVPKTEYNYVVLQKSEASTDITGNEVVLEYGVCKVVGTETTYTTHNVADDTIVYSVND